MVALISGAGRGIGKSIALALAEKGYNLALASRTISDLEELKSQINLNFPNIKVFIQSVDFTDKTQIENFNQMVKQQFGNIQIIVNNVGAYNYGHFENESDNTLEEMLAINTKAPYYLTKFWLRDFKSEKRGFIFNVLSILSKNIRNEAFSYTISKQASYAFHKLLVEELRRFQVKVTAIIPGSVNTSSWDGINAPTSEFVQPIDVSNAIIMCLNSSDHSYFEEIIVKPLIHE